MADLFVDPEIARASTLPASFYKDPAMFERVREEVFAQSWQFLMDSDGLKAPGTIHPLVMLEGLLDEPMVFTRDFEDQVHLMSNVCTHRGMQVAEGVSNGRHMRCRYHGRRFGLDGSFASMPEFEEVCNFPSPSDNLPKISQAVWAKLLFGGVKPRTSFHEWAGPMIERMGWLPIEEFRFEPSRAREYLVNANWALYVDNYLEGFHIPYVHASLNDSLDYGSYKTETQRWSNLQVAVSRGGEDVFDLPRSSPDFGEKISAYYYWLFPNTMFNFYPWGLSINVVRPLGPSLTKVSFLPYVWDASKLGQGAGGDLDRVEREDEAVVELVQRGVKSRFYDKGRFSVAREGNVHHFHRLLSEYLSASNT